MPTGTPGHFSGGAKGSSGHYDTATQTFRKAPAGGSSGGSKGGFAGKSSTVRPLTADEHKAAADHLAAAGQHHAAAHHRSSAEQMETEAPTVGADEGSMANGMYGQKVAGNKPPLGSGQRFADLKGKLAKEPGVDDPGALAASIGRKKYGAKKMGKLSHHEK